ncbi:MAG: tyrosine-type recombinase/integrase [Nitrospirae bacterium]|nr:tyrosine-type recombinase/integrase [Nitrospirota bacterium]
MPKLTKTIIDSTDPPEQGQIFVRDDLFAGFALRVTSGGFKSFVWEGKIKGQTKRVTLGQYGVLTLDQARARAFETKARILKGEDPAREKKEKHGEITFKDLSEKYLEQHAKIFKKTWEKDKSRIDNHLENWKGRRLSTFSRDEITKLHQRIGADNGKYEANRIIDLIRKIFNCALDWGMMPEGLMNPAVRIKKFPEEKRDRFLTPDEVKKFMGALELEPDEYWRAYFALSLLTGARRSELLSARWEDIDFSTAIWRIPMTKAGRPHQVPIPKAALKILEELPSLKKSEWLFPGPGKTGHLTEPKSAWRRIIKKAELQKVRIHDLRRTLGSWLAAEGASLILIGKTLNHSNVSTSAIYARLNQDPVRKALEANSLKMLGIKPKKKAKKKRSQKVDR